MATFRTVKGFRDFFPEDCALRNYIFDTWRQVARRYGFVEYEAPLVETTDLYRKKSGDEITSQLFCFEDKAGREISLRPEVTPSLARMATTRQRDYKKPMKWFQIGSCFRYEEPQEGRSREFIQFNADILGDASSGTDAELVALAVDVMLAFGIKAEDFVIRLSNRQIWTQYLTEKAVPEEHATTFLSIIDKIERAKPEDTAEKLSNIGLSLEDVRAFMTAADENHPIFATLRADLEARGLWQYVRIDASIVRGLAYYTGTVFEVFDLKHGLRAVAGGGRYDKLCALMSDGSVDMPSAGFAMGDVVLGILLSKTPGAQFGITDYLNSQMGVDAYVVVADEAQRAPALAAVQALRAAGVRVDFAMTAQKVGKQFQAAENVKARFALVFGAEYPQVQMKNLVSREQTMVAAEDLASTVVQAVKQPLVGKLIA
ncbi:histidine--tRNA ligase [Brevifollis gellanilyticus]|uniref:Histidine--tRNA ligase n=1 Tax=Brevifollis gellanilyticus TaxID=748831 RepID=A0A512ME90_9BACT|nr:histidine--tRNA ligase [Brevifollis gellanilyticus]GEP44711.1 histidine--tRNA ligase [Brevifollis gellanilyticus]